MPVWVLPLIAVPAWLEALGRAAVEKATAAAQAVADAAKAAVEAAAKARAEAIKEVQSLIDSGKKQEAIDKAITAFGIDNSNVKSLTYDSTVSGEAVATKDGTVRVGDEAFRDAAWLGSSLGHEIEIHVNEQAMKGNWYTGAIGTPLQEVQAYDYEIANADRYGTTKENLEDLEKRRAEHYDQLPDEYQKRVDAGDYTMKKGEEGD